jgi:flagellar protein FlaG
MEATPALHSLDEVSESVIISEASSSGDARSPQPVKQQPAKEDQLKSQKTLNVEEAAEEIAEKMNQVASVFSTSLAFSVDKPTGKTVIKVLDRETNEIIRQIPPEEMLRLIGKMRYVMGMLLDVET